MEENSAKEEVMELIDFAVRAGFLSDEEIMEEVVEYLEDNYEEEDLADEEWMAAYIEGARKLVNREQSQENYLKLDQAFHRLEEEEIVCLHCAGYTMSDGFEDANEVAEDWKEEGREVVGCCFYHQQDLEHLLDAGEEGHLYLAFGSYQATKDAAAIGEAVVKILAEEGLSVDWDHTVDTRICIKPFHWDKVYRE